jgi:hypothetical protein
MRRFEEISRRMESLPQKYDARIKPLRLNLGSAMLGNRICHLATTLARLAKIIASFLFI